MPSGTYIQTLIKCPFYITDSNKPPNLMCEGIANGKGIVIRFQNKDKKDSYIHSYCIEGYEKCLLYKIVYDKYKQ